MNTGSLAEHYTGGVDHLLGIVTAQKAGGHGVGKVGKERGEHPAALVNGKLGSKGEAREHVDRHDNGLEEELAAHAADLLGNCHSGGDNGNAGVDNGFLVCVVKVSGMRHERVDECRGGGGHLVTVDKDMAFGLAALVGVKRLYLVAGGRGAAGRDCCDNVKKKGLCGLYRLGWDFLI